eukprot:TRINITY_DN2809_c0_g1_i3.p1 TRINITY_DN2809_c0_g1~~TRINITY_DN2809_c0_g1_i3.p1  ORF type:complete len:1014 (+),score=288.23 TRINITY_DN2809_c0_g1_i3:252-3044(+)
MATHATPLGAPRKLSMSAVICWGAGGTGKTRTMFGQDGLAIRCIAALFRHGASSVKMQCVALRNDSCQDLLSGRRGVKVGVDDRLGAVIDADTDTCRTLQTADALLASVAERIEVASLSHFVCSATAFQGPTACARIFFVDGADITKRSNLERGQPELDELAALQRGHYVLQSCLSGIASGKDYRTLPFRETKLTRMLQHPLHYTAAGQGSSVVIFCLPQDEQRYQDCLCLLKTAELCQGIPDLPTISEYIDLLDNLVDKAEEGEARNKALQSKMKAMHTLRILKIGESAKLDDELGGKGAKLEQTLALARKAISKELKAQEALQMEEIRGELLKARRDYEAVQAEIEGATDIVEASLAAELERHLQERVIVRRDTEARMVRAREENDKEAFERAAARRRAEMLGVWETRVEKEVAQIQAEKDALAAKKGRASGPSRTNGLTPEQIAAKSELFRALDEIADLEERNEALRGTIRDYKAETQLDVATDSEDSEERAVYHTLGSALHRTTRPSTPESSVPPTPPSDFSGPPAVPQPVGSVERNPPSVPASRLLESYRSLGGDDAVKNMSDKEAFEVEREQFLFTVRKNDRMQEIFKGIVELLQKGTEVTFLNPDPHVLMRRFVARIEHDPKTEKSFFNIGGPSGSSWCLNDGSLLEIRLGQNSDQFNGVLQEVGGYSAVSSPQSMPPTTKMLVSEPHTLSMYAYRSITLSFASHSRPEVSFVADSSEDFERWQVGLHKCSAHTEGSEKATIIPQWSAPLDLSRNRDITRLAEKERHFCSMNHIAPIDYLNAKYETLSGNRIVTTLYDIRSASSLDLINSHKLFEFLYLAGYISPTALWEVRFNSVDDAKTAKRRRKEALAGPSSDALPNPEGSLASGFVAAALDAAKDAIDDHADDTFKNAGSLALSAGNDLISKERKNLLNEQGASLQPPK